MSFILQTKINKPKLFSQLVNRSELITTLNDGLSRKLTLISAPAGYGKTTIISQWLRQIDQPTAWYSIDKSDNDSVLFFTYLVSAIQTIYHDVGNNPLKLLQSQSKPPSMEYVLGSLINDISTLKKDLLLVIDDYHLIDSMEIHQSLNYLIEHLPHQMHLVIATRSDPPLKLARLRSQNLVTELRAEELTFTINETGLFFNKAMQLNLDEDDIQKLNKRVEGWVAGLQMAAISMQGRNDISGFVNAFTGSTRFIMDYLVEEVFISQTGNIQNFLIRTSILNRMNSALCNEITGQTNGQEILEQLEQKNLFIIPLDEQRNWYRYHHLFADLLQKRLRQSFPDQIKQLHQHASLGFEKQDFIPEAIDYALLAEDFNRAEDLINRIAQELWFRGEQGVLLKWADALPKKRHKVNPELYAILANCTALNGRFNEAESYIEAAERNITEKDKQLKGMTSAVRAYISDYRGDIVSAEKYGEYALSNLNDEYAIWRCLVSTALGDVHVQKGPLGPATESYQEAIRSGIIAGNNYIISLAKYRLVVMYQYRGQLRKATQLVEQYLSEENPSKNQSGQLNLVYGELLYEQNRLNEAAEHINKSIRLLKEQRHTASIPFCRMQLARIQFANQNKTGAAVETKKSTHLLEQSDIAPWVKGFVYNWKIRYLILCGELDTAAELVRDRGLSLNGTFTFSNTSEYLSYARYLVATGNLNDSLQLLQRLIERLISIDWRNLAYEAQVIKALVFQKTGQIDKAVEVLSSVIGSTEPGGYLRLFIDEGEPIAELLEIVQKQGIFKEYIDKILFEIKLEGTGKIVSAKQSGSPSAENLSEREIEVLRLLKTDLTSTEIAAELFVSANTIRTHIKSIYSKLGVHTRKEALKTAAEKGIGVIF